MPFLKVSPNTSLSWWQRIQEGNPPHTIPCFIPRGRQRGTELGLRNHEGHSTLFSFQRQKIPPGVLYSWNIPPHPSLAAQGSVQEPPSHPGGAAIPGMSPSLPSTSLPSPLHGRVYFCDESPTGFCVFPWLWLLARRLSPAVREASPPGAEQNNPAHANSTG